MLPLGRFLSLGSSFTLFCLLGQKNSLNVGKNTSLSNCYSSQKFVQFLVVSDCQLQVSWYDPCLLIITSGITCELKNLSCKVLHDGGKVYWCSCSDTFSVVSFP